MLKQRYTAIKRAENIAITLWFLAYYFYSLMYFLCWYFIEIIENNVQTLNNIGSCCRIISNFSKYTVYYS